MVQLVAEGEEGIDVYIIKTLYTLSRHVIDFYSQTDQKELQSLQEDVLLTVPCLLNMLSPSVLTEKLRAKSALFSAITVDFASMMQASRLPADQFLITIDAELFLTYNLLLEDEFHESRVYEIAVKNVIYDLTLSKTPASLDRLLRKLNFLQDFVDSHYGHSFVVDTSATFHPRTQFAALMARVSGLTTTFLVAEVNDDASETADKSKKKTKGDIFVEDENKTMKVYFSRDKKQKPKATAKTNTKAKATASDDKSAAMSLTDEDMLQKICQTAELLNAIYLQLAGKQIKTPNDVLNIAYQRKLIEYALQLAREILPAKDILSDSNEQNVSTYRLAVLRCLSVFGETCNFLRKEDNKLDETAALLLKQVNNVRNTLQHSSATGMGSDNLLSFLKTGLYKTATADKNMTANSASSNSNSSSKDNHQGIVKQSRYSPVTSIQKILNLLALQEQLIANSSHVLSNKLEVLAWEYMATFIGGDLTSRLELNEIFLENFHNEYSEKNHNAEHTFDLHSHVNVNSVVVLLHQVKTYRNDLSHAHLSLLEADVVNQSVADSLLGMVERMRDVKVGKSSPQAFFSNRFKPTMQLCWIILQLTNDDRKLKSDLEAQIVTKIDEFEHYLGLGKTAELNDRKNAVIQKIASLIQQYGMPDLVKETAALLQSVNTTTDKSNTKDIQVMESGLGLFKQYYQRFYEVQSIYNQMNNTLKLKA